MHIRDKPGVGTSKSSAEVSAPVNYHHPHETLCFLRFKGRVTSAPGGRTPMEHAYKSHTIVITTWASLDRNGYTPEVRISKKALIDFQTLKLSNAFPTKEEAVNALEAAKKWIDDKNPKHPQAATECTVDTKSRKRLSVEERVSVQELTTASGDRLEARSDDHSLRSLDPLFDELLVRTSPTIAEAATITIAAIRK
jgi:hypothetical protein